jgi:uncharacterized protein YbjT (DUF2867 family)
MERILVVGGTGLLGSRIVQLLREQGHDVSAPTHSELDLTNPASINIGDATRVIQTANGVMSKDSYRIDVEGTKALAHASRGARRFLYLSAAIAAPDSIVDFVRNKYAGQEAVRASGAPYTILRPTAFADVWKGVVVSKPGVATIFGDGNHPIDFISVEEVARSAVKLLFDPAAENKAIELTGRKMTLSQLVDEYERETGEQVKRKHIPVPVMRVMRHVVKPFNPVMSRLMTMGLQLVTS